MGRTFSLQSLFPGPPRPARTAWRRKRMIHVSELLLSPLIILFTSHVKRLLVQFPVPLIWNQESLRWRGQCPWSEPSDKHGTFPHPLLRGSSGTGPQKVSTFLNVHWRERADSSGVFCFPDTHLKKKNDEGSKRIHL